MPNLVILDDVFPLPLSAFRFTEFTHYLKTFPNSVIYASGATLSLLGESRSIEEVIAEFDQEHEDLRGRVRSYSPNLPLNKWADLIYFVFLSNARNFYQDLVDCNKPFIFTLYPAGAFEPYQKKTNDLLRRVMSLPGFRKVIVTQPFLRDYLIDGGYCPAEKISLIPGVVVPEEFLEHALAKTSEQNNEITNICFVAYKYLRDGREKGYDIFVDVARRLLAIADAKLKFHVVGGFKPGDVDDDDILPHLQFYPRMTSQQLLEFYDSMDILISPNRSAVPVSGRFDGFPTGAAVQAGLQGVALFASDCLRQNFYLKDRDEIVEINHSPTEIADVVAAYIEDRQKLDSLKQQGKAALHRLYSLAAQMTPRVELLRSELAATAGRITCS